MGDQQHADLAGGAHPVDAVRGRPAGRRRRGPSPSRRAARSSALSSSSWRISCHFFSPPEQYVAFVVYFVRLRIAPAARRSRREDRLQLELLKPRIALLDETDSGLDVDALQVVSEGINRVRNTGEVGVLLITHYTRILKYIQPDWACTCSPPGASSHRAAPSWRRCSRTRATRSTPTPAPRTPSSGRACKMSFLDVELVRKDFPILERRVHDGRQLVYLDSAGLLTEAAAAGPRRDERLLRAPPLRTTLHRQRRAPRWPRGHRALREGAEDFKVAAFIPGDRSACSQRPGPERGDLHQELLGRR